MGHPSQLKSKFRMVRRSILSHSGPPLSAKIKVSDGPTVHISALWATPLHKYQSFGWSDGPYYRILDHPSQLKTPSDGPHYATLGHPLQLKSKVLMVRRSTLSNFGPSLSAKAIIRRSILCHSGRPLLAKIKVSDGPTVQIIPLWATRLS